MAVGARLAEVRELAGAVTGGVTRRRYCHSETSSAKDCPRLSRFLSPPAEILRDIFDGGSASFGLVTFWMITARASGG